MISKNMFFRSTYRLLLVMLILEGFISCQGFRSRNEHLTKTNDSLENALKDEKKRADSVRMIIAENNNKPSFNDSLPILFKKVKKAVYLILTEKDSVISQGSCFVVSKEGIAISNYHLFQNASDAIAINDDGEKFMITDIIQYSEKDDYIVFKIGPSTYDFQFVEIAESLPDIGEQCFTVGNPKSYSLTLSDGIISGYRENDKYIQTNTEITYGSSGGPLFNKSGKVIGITTMGESEGGLNFAININSINLKSISEHTTTNQQITKSYGLEDILKFLNSYYDLLIAENYDALYSKYADNLIRYHKLFNIKKSTAIADHITYLKKYKILNVVIDTKSVHSFQNDDGTNIFYKTYYTIARRSDNKKLTYTLSTVMIINQNNQIASVFDNIISKD